MKMKFETIGLQIRLNERQIKEAIKMYIENQDYKTSDIRLDVIGNDFGDSWIEAKVTASFSCVGGKITEKDFYGLGNRHE